MENLKKEIEMALTEAKAAQEEAHDLLLLLEEDIGFSEGEGSALSTVD